MNTHQIEPEWLHSPRRVRRAPNRSEMVVLGCMRVFLLPFIAIGAGTLASAACMTLVLLFGQTVPATVIDKDTSYNSESGTAYYLEYRFSMNGVRHFRKEKVAHDEYSSWSAGSAIEARVLPFLPWMNTQIKSSHAGRKVLGRWGFSLFWNAIVFVFVWLAFIAPVLDRRLMTRGAPIIGHIVDKEIRTGSDSPDSYILHYEYAPDEHLRHDKNPVSFSTPTFQGATPSLTGKMTVSQDDYKTINIGDAVTVLFDPRRPKRSLLPRFSDWQIAS